MFYVLDILLFLPRTELGESSYTWQVEAAARRRSVAVGVLAGRAGATAPVMKHRSGLPAPGNFLPIFALALILSYNKRV